MAPIYVKGRTAAVKVYSPIELGGNVDDSEQSGPGRRLSRTSSSALLASLRIVGMGIIRILLLLFLNLFIFIPLIRL